MDSGAWWATDQRVTKSQTQLKRLSKHVNTAKYVYLVPLLVFRIYLPDTSSTTLYSSHYTFCITLFLFICFWLCWVFVAAARAFTLVVQGLLSSCGVWASHCGSSSLQGTGSRACGASEVAVCGGVVVTPSSKAQAQQLWYMGLIVLWPVGSSWVRYWTCVSWIGRWILYHWATREAHKQHIPFFF